MDYIRFSDIIGCTTLPPTTTAMKTVACSAFMLVQTQDRYKCKTEEGKDNSQKC